jgi:predicted DNA-binding transcriptional regulator AlpA
LSRVEAASYIGVSPSLFDELVKDGRMPKPIGINARKVWDRRRIEEAFTQLADDSVEINTWDKSLGCA